MSDVEDIRVVLAAAMALLQECVLAMGGHADLDEYRDVAMTFIRLAPEQPSLATWFLSGVFLSVPLAEGVERMDDIRVRALIAETQRQHEEKSRLTRLTGLQDGD